MPFLHGKPRGYRDFDLMLFDKLYVFDREDQVIYLICNIATDNLERNYREAESTLSEMERILSEPSENTVKPLRLLSGLSPIYQKDAYMQMVEKAKHYIRKGDVAQIVLTNGKKAQAEGSLIDTFDFLRKTDPTRYMCFLSSDDMEAAMASPEPIARLHNGTVMTERLAGSYPRGKTPQEDRAQAEALRTDAKAIDEHNMLVDDSRNEFWVRQQDRHRRCEGISQRCALLARHAFGLNDNRGIKGRDECVGCYQYHHAFRRGFRRAQNPLM